MRGPASPAERYGLRLVEVPHPLGVPAAVSFEEGPTPLLDRGLRWRVGTVCAAALLLAYIACIGLGMWWGPRWVLDA